MSLTALWPGPRYCPHCTIVVRVPYDATYAGASEQPVYLVKRINKHTQDWFWGCPNFPKCKYTENRPPTPEERRIKEWASANAMCGPHY